MKRSSNNRSGFTFLELLIVIAIIGLLLAMLVPAVNQIREAARRTECLNNIRQQAFAILNFESAHQCFPQATGLRASELPTTESYSGFLSIVSFTSRYPRVTYDREVERDGQRFPAYPDVNTPDYPLWSEQSPWLLCPGVSGTDSKFGMTSYGFCIGDVAKKVHNPEAIRGMFAVGKSQTSDAITDGLSTTIAIAEIGGSGYRSTRRHFAINQQKKFLGNPSLTSELVNHSNRYLAEVKLSEKLRGGNWACLLYTSPSPRDQRGSRMPSSA